MERVQLNLERLLPELRDLEKKKIFTKVRWLAEARLERWFRVDRMLKGIDVFQSCLSFTPSLLPLTCRRLRSRKS